MQPAVPPDAALQQFKGEPTKPGESRACIRVELNHAPLHFFARLQTGIQAIASPEPQLLWRFGGLYKEQRGDGLHHSALLWQERPKKGHKSTAVHVRTVP